MINLQKIYEHAPGVVQDAMVTSSGFVKAHRRYGAAYWEHRNWLEQFDKWSVDQAKTYQATTLQKFVSEANRESKFYQKFYDGIDVSQILSPHDLHVLPVLKKETLRKEMNQIYTVKARNSIEAHTGGTTGKSLVVRFTQPDFMRRMAMLDHFKSRHGFENRVMRRATFSGKHLVAPFDTSQKYWRYNASSKQMLYSTFHTSEQNLTFYVQSLNSFKPDSLDGFFTSMCAIANFIERNEIKLRFRPVAIFPTSETVTESGRALLERVFKARVFDQYASSEGAPFVTECAQGMKHVELSTGVFESVSDSNELLVTSFDTHGTPLIRYQIGDTMKFRNENETCTCGLNGNIVEEIGGRTGDHLVRADGVLINGGHVANLFKNMPNALIRAQVIQERIGHVTVLLQVDEELYDSTLDDLLKSEFLHTFSDSTNLEIKHVHEIQREPSGKYRLIKNLLE